MKIALIDNELCTRNRHSFPNLAIMKLSTYHKNIGDNVNLIGFNEIDPNSLFSLQYDIIYISKVFTDTFTPNYVYNLPNVKYGGTGFFYDKANPLPVEIEHSFPDYDIYKQIPSCKHDYYTKFSIGFMTRGCVRKCKFCVNRNSNKVSKHSELDEFVDKSRPYIMLLDDNITAYTGFADVFYQLNNTGKQFVFKQGMDFRLLNLDKMQILWQSNYYEHSERKMISAKTFHFAFDNIKDYNTIERNLKVYYENKPHAFKSFFYVLVGYDFNDVYNDEFYYNDVLNTLKRCKLLFKYNCYAYIMVHKKLDQSPYKWIINKLKNIFNNPSYITNKTILQAFEQKKEYKLIEWIKVHDSEFLEIQFNSKLFKS